MANLSKLLISTGTLTATREDPRTAWEFFTMPPSQLKKLARENGGQKKRNLFRALLNAFRLP